MHSSVITIYDVQCINQSEVRLMAKKQSHTGYRSSQTGRFVKGSYAKAHPNTTQKESIPNPGRGDTGRGKKK